jgi:large subunit ribosomal protein L10
MAASLQTVKHATRECFKFRSRPRRIKKEFNPKKLIVSKKMLLAFSQSNFVAVYHYSSMSIKEWDSIRGKLDPSDIKLMVVPHVIAKKSLLGTPHESATSLFFGNSVIAYSEQSRLKELLSVTKTEPKLILLGGLVDNELMTPNGIEDYSKLPSKMVLHQQLLGTLMEPLMSLQSSLCGNSTRLYQLISEHIKKL